MNLKSIIKKVLETAEENPETRFTRGWFYDTFLSAENQDKHGVVDVIFDFLVEAGVINEKGLLITIAQLYRLLRTDYFDIQFDEDEEQIPDVIPQAGYISPFLIVEPISPDSFVVSFKNKVEIKKIKIIEEKHKKKKMKHFVIDIAGKEVEIINSLFDLELKRIVNYNLELLEEFLKDPPSTEEIFESIFGFFDKYIDAEKYAFELATLFVLQSYLFKVIDKVFYLQIKAPFGGGKTTFGTAIISLCRHGYSVSSVSAASVGRGIERLQATIFFDELDQQRQDDENSLFAILRAGHSKEAPYYERATSDGKIQVFNVFSPKLFSVHANIEEALAQRSFSIVLYPTKLKKYAVINLFRDGEEKNLRTKILAWFLHNGKKYLWRLYATRIAEVEGDIFITTKEGKRALEKIKERLGEGISPRNVSFAFLLMLYSEILGIELKHFDEILAIKMREDEEYKNLGIIDIIRETLLEWYENIRKSSLKDVFVTESGEIVVPYDIIYKSVNNKIRKLGLQALSARKFRGYLRELGIDRKNTFKKVKLMQIKYNIETRNFEAAGRKTLKMAFVFTQGLCKMLGVEYWNAGGGLDEFTG